MACGIDPNQSKVFIQSHVKQHTELAWLLKCVTPMGWLNRMTQFKSKSLGNESVGVGLYDYPVLMAADILLYDTDVVPVGSDQKQHIEITRDIANRFNTMFGETFTLLEELIRKSGARIMAFDNPEEKMSKSHGEMKAGHSIGLLDDEKTIKNAIMRAKTDAGSEVDFDNLSAGVKNLLELYEVLTKVNKVQLYDEFSGKGYGHLKKSVLGAVLDELLPLQAKYYKILEDTDYLDEVLADGAFKATELAEKTMIRTRKALGIC